jgi:ppGpp synthetase/RelA/SpoT-type nucleotidyltranferase
VLTRRQIDELGERLRKSEEISGEDRRALDEYRRSLTDFSNRITDRLRLVLSASITERPGKTTPSIVAKLKRQPIALSAIRDIAGGRVIVDDLVAQDTAARRVSIAFPEGRMIDRRETPMHGYHAVHLVLREQARSYELQIRTRAQQRWAELSEKFADLVGFEIKYGGGPPDLQKLLATSGKIVFLSERVRRLATELLSVEDELVRTVPGYQRQAAPEELTRDAAAAEAALREELVSLEEMIEAIEGSKT